MVIVMKKKFLSFCLAICIVLSISVVPAFAYSEWAHADITPATNNRLIFKGTVQTDAPRYYVRQIQTNMYVYNEVTDTVYCNRRERAETVSYVTISDVLNSQPRGVIINEVTGAVYYSGVTQPFPVQDKDSLNLLGRTVLAGDLGDSYDVTAVAEERQKIRNSILESYGYTPENYEYYHCGDVTAVIPDEQYIDIRHQLNLREGDTRPGFYVTPSKNTIIAVNMNADGQGQVFKFHKNVDSNWVLAAF